MKALKARRRRSARHGAAIPWHRIRFVHESLVYTWSGGAGGPLLDSRGRLIGINTAIADPTGKGASAGIGFAIPIDTVKGLVTQILQYGRVVRPVLGITIAPPQVGARLKASYMHGRLPVPKNAAAAFRPLAAYGSSFAAALLSLPRLQAVRQMGLQGVLVLDVPPGTPAAKAGMQGITRDAYGRMAIGDVIVGLNGQAVKSEGDLFGGLALYACGSAQHAQDAQDALAAVATGSWLAHDSWLATV